MNLPVQIRCAWCGKLKPIAEMNGYDPITGDTSQAQCMRLNDCDSDQAREIKEKLLKQLGIKEPE